MDTQTQIVRMPDCARSLGGRTARFGAATPLLCALSELDPLGVVTCIGAREDQLGIAIDDDIEDEFSGDTFALVRSQCAFVAIKRVGRNGLSAPAGR